MNSNFINADNIFFNDIKLIDNDANNFFSTVNSIHDDITEFDIDNVMVNVNDYCPNCGYNILHVDNHDACLNCGFNRNYAIDGQTENAYNSTEQINDVFEQINDMSEQINNVSEQINNVSEQINEITLSS